MRYQTVIGGTDWTGGGSDDTAPRFLFVIVIVIIIIIILYLCSLDEVPVLYLIDLGGTLVFFFSKLDCPKEEKKENKYLL